MQDFVHQPYGDSGLQDLLHHSEVGGWCFDPLLGGSWDLVSKVISPLIGVISNYKYSYLIYNASY